MTMSADKKYSKAQYELGYLYEIGDYGLPIDLPKAIQLYQASANKKNVKAMYKLGHLYETGMYEDILPKNEELAMQWYIKLVSYHCMDAQNGKTRVTEIMKTYLTNYFKDKDHESSWSCVVCLDTLKTRVDKAELSIIAPCKHIFCTKCIRRCYETNESAGCPVCRSGYGLIVDNCVTLCN